MQRHRWKKKKWSRMHVAEMMNGWPVTAARLLSEVLYGRFRVAELGRGARKRESDGRTAAVLLISALPTSNHARTNKMSEEEGSFVYATTFRCLPDWMPSVRGNHSPALVISSLSVFFTEGQFKFGLFTLVT